MAVKRGRIVYVEGCRCEVIEEDIESGIVDQSDVTVPRSFMAYTARSLVVAPDGSLVLPNPFAERLVDPSQPNEDATVRRLRRMARQMQETT